MVGTEFKKECRLCLHLLPHPGKKEWLKDANGMPPWRCPFGRFDRPTPAGRPVKCWFAWSGIWTPNREVARAQAGCQRFELHPQSSKFTKTWRVLR